VEELAAHLIGALGSVPALVVYVIAAVWVGIECFGIGVPVEPVMLFLGSLVALGDVNLPLALLAMGLGSVVLGSLAYWAGRRYGTQAIARFGRYVGLKPARAAHLELWLRRRGALGVFGLRVTPLVRPFTSFVSGVADVPQASWVLGTFVGSALYCAVWVVLGNVFGADYQAPLHALDHFGLWGIAAVIAVVLALFLLHRVAGRVAVRGLEAHFQRHHKLHLHQLKTADMVGMARLDEPA
jgi:membrane protein DedA with SNARE-associated domain